MDYDNSASLFNKYTIPRGLGVAIKENIPAKSFQGGNRNTDHLKEKQITRKNRTRKKIERNDRQSRKQYTK